MAATPPPAAPPPRRAWAEYAVEPTDGGAAQEAAAGRLIADRLLAGTAPAAAASVAAASAAAASAATQQREVEAELRMYREDVERLEARISQLEEARGRMGRAAERAADGRGRARLLGRVFAGWARGCLHLPARETARRCEAEVAGLRRSVSAADERALQASQLAEAAELHLDSLREQNDLLQLGGVSERRATERLREQLAEAEAEAERGAVEASEARAEAEAARRAAALESGLSSTTLESPGALRALRSDLRAAQAEAAASAEELRDARAEAEAQRAEAERASAELVAVRAQLAASASRTVDASSMAGRVAAIARATAGDAPELRVVSRELEVCRRPPLHP